MLKCCSVLLVSFGIFCLATGYSKAKQSAKKPLKLKISKDNIGVALQAEAARLYNAEVYPDMVSRHRGRSERGRSGAATYNSQVTYLPPLAAPLSLISTGCACT